jgi:hypothetical protein
MAVQFYGVPTPSLCFLFFVFFSPEAGFLAAAARMFKLQEIFCKSMVGQY